MKLSEIRAIAANQKEQIAHYDTGLSRDILPTLPNTQTHALIVSGIRGCGKSTLLLQFVQSLGKPWFYLNFEDIRLFPFARQDFALLDSVIEESGCRLILFDEIQAAENWELYIRQKLDQHFQVLITGSNASLLSSELGTKLTGRHISKELFPFSYAEFLAFFGLSRNLASLDEYLERGGFPEYLKTGNPEVLIQLQSDILYRDIAVRYGIRNVSSLKRLFTILLSSAGHLISPSKLALPIGVKSPSTVLEFFSHFEASYLTYIMPRFSWSPKSQALAPKKVYVVDSGLIKTGSVSFSPDSGSLFENFVYLELRRHSTDLYYFSEQGHECDFIVNARTKAPLCLQVCRDLNSDNEAREVDGLIAAMDFFSTKIGYIITADTRDTLLQSGKQIEIIPAHSVDFLAPLNN